MLSKSAVRMLAGSVLVATTPQMVLAVPNAVPDSPTHVCAVSNDTAIELTWTEDDTRAVSFTISRALKKAGPYEKLATIKVNPAQGQRVREFDDDGTYDSNTDAPFNSSRVYYYLVKANDALGGSSVPSMVRSGPILPLPQAPFGVTIQAGDAKAILTLDPAPGADVAGYNIYRSQAGGPSKLVGHTSGSSTTYTDTGLSNGVQYSYYVTGYSDAGESGPCPTATVVPKGSLSNSKEIIAAAEAFCKAIGNPDTDISSAVFPEPTDPESPPDYYETCWLVQFQDGTRMTIVDGSREIVSYFVQQSPELKSLVRSAITEAKVLAIYRNVLDASRVDQTQLGSAQASGQLTPCNAGTVWHEWNVYARRMYKNIPYDSQSVTVSMDAETGVVNSLDVVFGYPSPETDAIKLTKDQAIKIGKQFMIDNQIAGAYVNCVLSVVQPNAEFAPEDQNNNGKWDKPGPAVIAWDCNFNDPNGWNTHVWFSATDGTCLGGGKVGHEPGFKF